MDALGVAYDPILGYPTAIRVDPEARVVDEEQSCFASSLRRTG